MSKGQRISTSTGRRRPGGDGARGDAILTPTASDNLWGRADEEGWRILLVDDDEAVYPLVRDVVAESRHIRFHLDWARTVDEALQTLAQEPYDVCLLAYMLGERTGIDLLAELEATHPQLPVIMLTSQGNHDEDLAAMRAGAMDYLVKTRLDADRLERAIRYALTQRRTEEALWESEARNRALLVAIPDMIFTFREDGTYLDFMPAPGVEPYVKPEDFLGKTVHEVLPADKAERTMQDIRRALETGAVQRHEYILASGDEQRDFEYRMVPSGDDEVLAIVRDITERKQAEEALRESEERFRDLYNNAPAAYLSVGRDGHIRRANQQTAQLLGYALDDLIGRPVFDLYADTPAGKEKARQVFQRFVAGERTHDEELQMRRADGHLIWIALTVDLVRDADGEIVETRSIVIDITERKQAEEALRESEQKYRRYAERLQSLRDIDQAILAVRPPKEVAHMAVEHLLQMIPCQQASAILFDFEEDTLHRVTAYAASPAVEVDHYALRIAAPLLDEEVHLYQAARSHFDSDEDPDPADGKPHCILDVLLKAQTQTLGTLSLKTDAATTFTDEEVDIAREIAKPLAIAFQNAALFDRLETSRERLQALSHRLVEVQEAERRHLAQELHDEVGQLLTGLLFLLRASARVSESPLRDRLKEAETITQQVLGQVRELSLNLRPAMLNKLGLLPTLLWHFDRYTKQTDIKVDFRHLGCEQRLDAQVETAAYRVVQEALTNVARHARTAQATVRLMANQERLLVEIEDQGEGFDLKKVMATNASTGLSSMQERVGLLSGVLRIETSPEQGTHILAELPLKVPTMHEDRRAS